MRSLRLGNLAGIDIKLHPTFLLVLLWVAVDWERAWGRAESPVWFGFVFVLLLFACVLLHELGHALMARQFGLRVHDVTLSVIGGVARFDSAPLTSRGELAICLAGPAANFAIVIALLPLILLAGVVAGYGPGDYLRSVMQPGIPGLMTGLFAANLLLLAFNLLPAFPMDGGRLLRAGLSGILGRERATAAAVRFGQVLALGLGLVAAFRLHSLSLALIAVFLIVAAETEMRAVRVESSLRRMRVGQFALWDMGGIAPDRPLKFALRGGARDIVVTDRQQVVGMLWRNDLLNALSSGGGSMVVADIMEPGVVPVDVDDPVFDVHRRMETERRPALPVAEHGQYRGVFTSDRLVHVYRQVAPPVLPWMDPNASLGELVSGILRPRAR
ncbi:MAG: site-2 protease family protein [Chloroflexota bacterium]